jgi:hypothetical protein
MTKRNWIRGILPAAALLAATAGVATASALVADAAARPAVEPATERGASDAERKARLLAERWEAAPSARPAAAPANDFCTGAEAIPPAGPFPWLSTVAEDVTGATTSDDPGIPTCQADVSRSLWWTLTPDRSGSYTFSLCASDGTATTVDDAVLAVWTSSGGCLGPFTQETAACDDDSCPIESFQPTVTLSMSAGTPYFIVAWLYGAPPPTAGNTAVQLRATRVVPPDNDRCPGATPISLGRPVAGTSIGASADYGLSGGGCFVGIGQNVSNAPGREVVFSFTAPSAGAYSFRVTTAVPSGFDPVLVVSSSCPAASGTVAGCLGAANRNASGVAEEVASLPLASGEEVWIFVDDASAGAGYPFVLEVFRSNRESEPDDSPATASPLSCGAEGTISPAGEVDFWSLGAPAAGSRVFAIVDGGGAGNSDFDLRLTTDADTLEFDDANADVPFGTTSPTVAGAPATGVPLFLRVSHASGAVSSEPYRLFAAVRPALGAASIETEPNDTPATATPLPGGWASGSLPLPTPSADVDLFSFEVEAGEMLFVSLDGDPLRDGTPLNGRLELLDPAGAVVVAVNDPASTSDTTPGSGSLTASTPFSPAESLLWRADRSGSWFAKVAASGSALGASGAGDYLLSVTRSCSSPPTIVAAGGLSRMQGEAPALSSVATVSDFESAAGTLAVFATTLPTGLSLTDIQNAAGAVSALLGADCTATPGANDLLLRVVDGDGVGATATLRVDVVAAPSVAILAQPPGHVGLCIGGSGSIAVATSGPATWQWCKDGGAISGATSATLPLVSVDASAAGEYHCEVGGGCVPTISETTEVTVHPLVAATPGVPVLSLPSNGATGVPLGPTLEWGAVAGAGRLKIFLGTTNPPPFAAELAGDATSWRPLLAPGAWYWRVAAYPVAGSGGAVWSELFSFATQTPAEHASSLSLLAIDRWKALPVPFVLSGAGFGAETSIGWSGPSLAPGVVTVTGRSATTLSGSLVPDPSAHSGRFDLRLVEGGTAIAALPGALLVRAFTDVGEGDFYFDSSERMVSAGIMGAFSGVSGPEFRPTTIITRGDMGEFMVKAHFRERKQAVPDRACLGYFPDVPCGHGQRLFIEWARDLGITLGNAQGNFVPDANVSRAEMAAFLGRLEFGGDAGVPKCEVDPGWNDLPLHPDWAKPYINLLRALRITAGCQASPLEYCPLGIVQRSEIATFLARVTGEIPLP